MTDTASKTAVATTVEIVMLPLDVTPQKIPAQAEALADLDRVVTFLTLLVTAPDMTPDKGAAHLRAAAARLLERDNPAGDLLISRMARVAYDYAYQLGEGPGADIADYIDYIPMIIYNLAQQGAEAWFPLRFEAPGVLASVLEMALARLRLEAGVIPFSSRQLARLARTDEKTVDMLLEQQELGPEPYGVSMRELQEMSQGECNYWHGQGFATALEDVSGWLTTMPGFIPTRMGTLSAAA